MSRKKQQCEDGEYSTEQVALLSGASITQLRYWVKEGILVPSICQSTGQGSWHIYSFNDLLHLRFIVKLKENGWSLQKIRQAIEAFSKIERDANPLGNAILVGQRGVILAMFKTKHGEQVLTEALTAGGQLVMDIVLETMHEEVRHILRQSK